MLLLWHFGTAELGWVWCARCLLSGGIGDLKCASNNTDRHAVLLSGSLWSFVDELQSLQKATTSFIMSVCPYVRPSVLTEHLGSYWKDFHDISYWRIFRKTAEKIQASLKPGNNNGYFSLRPMYIFVPNLAQLFLDKRFIEDQNTHLCPLTLFFFFRNSCLVWDNVERGWPQMTIWRMRIACWIHKTTNTHSHFSTARMVARTRLNVTL